MDNTMQDTTDYDASSLTKLLGGIQWGLSVSYLLATIGLLSSTGYLPWFNSGLEVLFSIGTIVGFVVGYFRIERYTTSPEQERYEKRHQLLFIALLLLLGVVGMIVVFPAVVSYLGITGSGINLVWSAIPVSALLVSYVIVYWVW